MDTNGPPLWAAPLPGPPWPGPSLLQHIRRGWYPSLQHLPWPRLRLLPLMLPQSSAHPPQVDAVRHTRLTCGVKFRAPAPLLSPHSETSVTIVAVACSCFVLFWGRFDCGFGCKGNKKRIDSLQLDVTLLRAPGPAPSSRDLRSAAWPYAPTPLSARRSAPPSRERPHKWLSPRVHA